MISDPCDSSSEVLFYPADTCDRREASYRAVIGVADWLPENFENVPLGKKEKEKLMRLGLEESHSDDGMEVWRKG